MEMALRFFFHHRHGGFLSFVRGLDDGRRIALPFDAAGLQNSTRSLISTLLLILLLDVLSLWCHGLLLRRVHPVGGGGSGAARER
jgi:hypothetical protein